MHTGAPIHYTGTHICAPVSFTSALLGTPVTYTGALSGEPVHVTSTHQCTAVQPISAHLVHAFNSLTCALMCVYLVGRHTHVHAYFQITRAHGAHTHKTPLYGPPYSPCPKNEILFLCRMIRPLT
jgi:hypothetical protein